MNPKKTTTKTKPPCQGQHKLDSIVSADEQTEQLRLLKLSDEQFCLWGISRMASNTLGGQEKAAIRREGERRYYALR
jgi:hypothetical protein